MPWQMPIQNAWQLHLVHQPQEHYKVIDALGCYRQFFFHAPQYARKFLFCLVHYANGESIRYTFAKTRCVSQFGETVLSGARSPSKASVAHQQHIFFFNLAFFIRLAEYSWFKRAGPTISR